ncbi:type IX secretion system motor protein PorM/GldM [Mesonia maritima]|uniref:Gliding motility-associated protein GldM n=1 Tax=Mesonia maritima TaxID=1793873 RepID=A0ABU1K3P8_9FLAO|nr:gliding motility protein GldM [Mesonia maritima]MDR6300226.1 gliding motility-associated protein GldM [Mesonia maritima]
MAGGKQTPRQKMINLMYLVFIAMMALNMSKEVLTAFGMINEDLAEANENAEQRNASFMAGLAEKATEQPKVYKPLQQKAQEVQKISSELNNYIAGLKQGALETEDDPEDYEAMDKSGYFDELFYQSKITDEGQKFINEMDEYRNQMIALLGTLEGPQYRQIEATVKEKFKTEEVVDGEGVKKEWINYHFIGYPLIASLTKLTQWQNNIKTVENQLLSAMMQGEQASQLSMSKYQAIVIPDKTAFFSGENFKGKVVLGRFDDQLSFDKVMINGNDVSDAGSTGTVQLDFPAGNVGEQNITGELQFKEGDSIVKIPVKTSYAVIPKPNSAVISADKMNVVYRGVDNPMTVSIPGVPSVTANAPGLRSSGGAGNYVMNVTNVKSRDVTINVSGKLPTGETVSDSKKFRIKDIPRPVGTVRGEDGNGGPVRMQRNGLEISTISAEIPDFDFELKLNVSGFKMQIPGQPIVQVSGQKLNGAAKRALQGAKRGDVVQIFDIEAKIAGNSSYRLPPVSPVIVQLTN